MDTRLITKIVLAKVLEVVLLIESYVLLVAVSGILAYFLGPIIFYFLENEFLHHSMVLYPIFSIEGTLNILYFITFLVFLPISFILYLSSFKIFAFFFGFVFGTIITIVFISIVYAFIKEWINWNIRNFKK